VINFEMVQQSADVMGQDTMAPFVKMILMSAHCLFHHAMRQLLHVLILQAPTFAFVRMGTQVSYTVYELVKCQWFKATNELSNFYLYLK
jgi:hypothetical protein